MRPISKLGFTLALIPALMALGLVSCAVVRISDAYRGVVVDADSGAPVANAIVLVRVMRVSSYDGASQIAKKAYFTNQRGEFKLPVRRKVVESVTERMEEMQYFDFIAFGKQGYEPREFRSDDDSGPFAVLNAGKDPIVVRLKKVTTQTAP